MRRMWRARKAALVGVLVLGGSLAGCASDPVDLVTETFDMTTPLNFAPNEAKSGRYTRNIPRPQGDIAIKKIQWRLVDEAGAEIPRSNPDIHFHHVVVDTTKPMTTACGASDGRWNAPGSERTVLELPYGFAFFANAADRWGAQWDIMNMSGRAINGVRVQYDITYTRTRDTLIDVTPHWLDAGGCGVFQFPIGPTSPDPIVRATPYRMPTSGRIVAVRGHMHDGALGVQLTRAVRSPEGAVGAGEVICDFAPPSSGGGHDHGHAGAGGGTGHGSGIPLCQPGDAPVADQEELLVSVGYPRPAAEVRDAMGSTLVYVADGI